MVKKECFRVVKSVKSAVGVPLFKALGHEVLVDMIRLLEPDKEEAGSVLAEEGKLGAEMFFIIKGVADMLHDVTDESHAVGSEGGFVTGLKAFPGRSFRVLKELKRADMFGVSKNDEFCIKNEELYITNKEFCIKNKELCIKNDEFCI